MMEVMRVVLVRSTVRSCKESSWDKKLARLVMYDHKYAEGKIRMKRHDRRGRS